VASVVIGSRSMAQYEQSLAGFTLRLPEDIAARLEEVSGPPPAPVTGLTSLPWSRPAGPTG
jgi:aryl-alcohol dehydrogenase-like predicted oxidoreductase